MEKYSKHLESIVAERTADLVAEKAKTDRLLYSKYRTEGKTKSEWHEKFVFMFFFSMQS